MKKAIICHGSGSSPESFWIPSIKRFLESKGYKVLAPNLPDPDQPDLEKWLPAILNSNFLEKGTVIIGHSSGAPLILSVLEKSNVVLSKAILVAGYARSRKGSKKQELILQEKYDWEIIKKNVDDIIFINSDNDPWGCDHNEGLYMWNKLGGTLILRSGEGHMGSDKFNQPYKEFPLLEKLLDS
ncbi:MAG: alpha/beta fold hydrolase [Patescibacteria group bacterium]